ncbi:hypothetical protein [uncultured Clostridium sp.]|uniref:YxiG family protein n=1 Tax=uncultured Clostridium sp. TaxID=59620 RepID=UPI0028E22C40|nr:hypothetical protein [uncultured Clostridium sp.]
MKESELQNKLNELWAGVIELFQINILKNTISFIIKVIEDGQEHKYNVVFNGVSSYYFVHDSGESRYNLFDPEDDDYLELTSIDYYKNGLDIKMKSFTEEWAKQYYSNTNFVLEIWSSILFIEAKSVTINKETFEVGYSKK